MREGEKEEGQSPRTGSAEVFSNWGEQEEFRARIRRLRGGW